MDLVQKVKDAIVDFMQAEGGGNVQLLNSPSCNLFNLVGDFMGMQDLFIHLESIFGVRIGEEYIFRISSIQQVCDLIAQTVRTEIHDVPAPTVPKTCIVFPGQGSQRVGMVPLSQELIPEVKMLFAQAQEVLGYDLLKICQEGT